MATDNKKVMLMVAWDRDRARRTPRAPHFMTERYSRSALAALMILLSAPHWTAAEEGTTNDLGIFGLEIEELAEMRVEVWTATKVKKSLDEAPAVMTVVTREEIQRYGYRSVAEVLEQVPGFYGVDDHMIPNFGVRGVAGGFMDGSGSIKVMIDGQNVVARSTGSNWLGPELIPMTAIERIEIIRGPASALYGADAFLGVVNIITVSGEDLSLGRLEGGGNVTSHGETGYDVDAALGTRKGDLEFLLSARVSSEDRSGLEIPKSSPALDIPYYRGDDTTARGLELFSQVAHGRLTYHHKDTFRVSLNGHAAQIARGGEFSPWSQLSYGLDENGRERGTVISLYEGMVGLQVSVVPLDTLSLDWRITYTRGGPTDSDRIELGNDMYYVKRDFGHDTLETSLEGAWEILDDLTAVVGAEFIYDWENLPSSLKVARVTLDGIQAGEIMESSSTRQGTAELSNIGAFLQAGWSAFQPYLDLTGGVRYDNHSLYGHQVSGRVGAVVNPIDKLHFKMLWGSAFKAPSPLLLYAVPHEVMDIDGNPDLKPQKVHTAEVQLIATPVRILTLSTGLAHNTLFDKAEFVQQGINRSAVNLSSLSSLSSESEATLTFEDRVRASLGFDYQWTNRYLGKYEGAYRSDLVGRRNVIYPNFILRGGLSARIPKIPVRGGLRVMFVGQRPSSEMNALENVGMYYLPRYVLLNASLATEGIEIVDDRETVFSVTGRNLTNRQVADPGFAGVDYPLSPLTVFFQVSQKL